ncbi:TPM domain-containing protein [Marispirochaeta sp.]|jgi:putative membrane protein|uniref:TPM domain-containing protein n=1 Tax=Marispirochaeta sp. TaxID=2038653 RepID=UPI0029C96883|nr:TPM domain-containing protein [Marispirochaeta sp.]
MKPLLSESDSQRIAAAVAEAESSSGGEIATAIIRECDDYGFRELVFALIAGFISFTIVALFDSSMEALFSSLFWGFNPALLPFIYSWIALLCGTAVFFLAQIPAVDRLVVPKKVMTAAVQARARRHFMEAGVYDTLDHTGILIFVSLLEQQVELIADRGINEKVKQKTWKSIVDEMTRTIAAGKPADALVKAVAECGAILAENIERRQQDKNELGDAPEELESGS